MITLNQPAPDFTLMGSDKKEHALSDYRGSLVVLYFYPRDNTPGCTLEAEGFRDTPRYPVGPESHRAGHLPGHPGLP